MERKWIRESPFNLGKRVLRCLGVGRHKFWVCGFGGGEALKTRRGQEGGHKIWQ